MNPDNSEFILEQQHLDQTIEDMQHIISALESGIEARVQKISRSLSIKDEVSAYVHSLMRSDHAAKLDDIERALPSPYFGRVDFREDGTDEYEKFYIGRTKIARPDIASAADILVFDWRDPVSTIFYECQNGRATYDVLGRYTYTGDVRLKRQYKIESACLISMSDDEIYDKLLQRQQEAMIADPFLLERLLQGSGEKLKDIVTSIRSEQNEIIREPLNQVVVIQGVAGSGKSTIGLHRLSYLLYNEKLNPKKLAVIAPNRVFLDYISDILPEIDAQDVQQLTFEDLAGTILGTETTIAPEPPLPPAVAAWKGARDFSLVLQTFLDRQLEKFCLKLTDIVLFDGQLTITRQEQLEHLLQDTNLPYNKRLAGLEGYIRFRVRNYLEVVEAKNRRGMRGMTDKLLEKLRKEGAAFLEKHFAKWPFWQPNAAYVAVFHDKASWKSLRKKGADPALLAEHSVPLLKAGQFSRDDLAPLCWLKLLLDGYDSLVQYDHIVVDEGQDLSLLEYLVLCRLSRNMSFTVMGDMLQGIHGERGLNSWQELLKDIFGQAKYRYFEVNYSYRSAKEIVDLFNQVMPETQSKAIPVYEIGSKPQIRRVLTEQHGWQQTALALEEFKQAGCRSVGILTRHEQQAAALFAGLQSLLPDTVIHLVTGSSAGYKGGVTLLPISLAKGLEFDGVIVWNASEKEFGAGIADAKLLYVALSRAMYHLRIFYQGRLTPLLGK